MATIPLDSIIPGLYGQIDDNMSTEAAYFQLGRAVIWLKRDGPIPPDLLAFLVEGFRRQVDGLERRGARGRFIECVERGEPIPPALRAEIVAWLRKQMDKGTGASGWLGGMAGRPPKGKSWDGMRAWYHFHLDPAFNTLPKRSGDGGRAAAVGAHIHQSESSVQGALREFARTGFTSVPAWTPLAKARDIWEQNLNKARLFCRLWLGLPDGEDAPAPVAEATPVDILTSWAQQADHPKPAPAQSPADIEARAILNHWINTQYLVNWGVCLH